MNKRIVLYVISITLVSVTLIYSIYQYKYSYAALLSSHGFNKDNIIVSQGYTLDPRAEVITKVVLLHNNKHLAIVGFEKNRFGLWQDFGVKGSIDNPANEQYVMYALNMMRKSWEGFESEKHLLVATFIEGSSRPLIIGNSDFYLSVDYFKVDDKILLFAHAIAVRNKDSFTSDEVITYINSHLK